MYMFIPYPLLFCSPNIWFPLPSEECICCRFVVTGANGIGRFFKSVLEHFRWNQTLNNNLRNFSWIKNAVLLQYSCNLKLWVGHFKPYFLNCRYLDNVQVEDNWLYVCSFLYITISHAMILPELNLQG